MSLCLTQGISLADEELTRIEGLANSNRIDSMDAIFHSPWLKSTLRHRHLYTKGSTVLLWKDVKKHSPILDTYRPSHALVTERYLTEEYNFVLSYSCGNLCKCLILHV